MKTLKYGCTSEDGTAYFAIHMYGMVKISFLAFRDEVITEQGTSTDSICEPIYVDGAWHYLKIEDKRLVL